MTTVVLFSVLVLVSTQAVAGVWSKQTIDGTADTGDYNSMVLDSSGRPCISYYDYENGDLKYAHWNGTTWMKETVDSAGNVGLYTSLKLNSEGQPCISYYDSTNYDLKYAFWNGTTWTKQVVDSAGTVGSYTSLAMDSSGNPCIGYRDQGHGYVKYALWNGSAWIIQTIDSAAGGWGAVCLVVNAAGNPCLSYCDDTNDDLKYAYWTGAAWVIQTVDSVGNIGYYNSLALDSFGKPRIAYYDTTNRHLKYASWNGSSWVTETVDSAAYTGMNPSLVIDSSNTPHISYTDNYWGDLKYAWWNGTTWVREQTELYLDPASTSLALDSSGNPHICFHNHPYDGLYYTSYDGTAWNVDVVECTGAVGGSSSIVDVGGYPHILYYDFSHYSFLYPGHRDIKHAWWNGSMWTTETLASQGDLVDYCDSILDSNGRVHASCYDRASDTLKYARWNGSSWETQVVDTQGPYYENSLRLDRTGKPHIAYYKYVGNWFTLFYASWNGTSWVSEVVDRSEYHSLGDYNSLALDSMDRPHISYRDFEAKALKYAHWDGTQWVVQTVATTAQYVQWSSIALDSQDRPHIAFWDDGDHLRYARWNGSEWSTQVVDPDSDNGINHALAIDKSDRPHIVYSDETNDVLKYAYWDGSSWVKQTIDNTYGTGRDCSIVLDSTGNPHIGYDNYYRSTLNYATPTIKAPTVTDEGIYTSGVPVTASWTTAAGLVEYRYALGPSPSSFVVNWKSAGAAAQAAESISLVPGQKYYWFVRGRDSSNAWTEIGNSDGVAATASCTLGEARGGSLSVPVLITDLVTTSTAADFPGLWFTSTTRASGVSVPASWSLTRGSNVQAAGILSWQDGVPVLSSPELKYSSSAPATSPLGLLNKAAANDIDESLNYRGISPVGMLVTVWGKVTGRDDSANMFYIDDGSHLVDGMGPSSTPYVGLRVVYGAGITPPNVGKHVSVTGIRTIEKVTLTSSAIVNGKPRS